MSGKPEALAKEAEPRKPEAKTRCQLCQKDKFCGDVEIKACKGYERWVSEVDFKKEMDEFGRQNEALAVVCGDLKEKNEALEGRLEAITTAFLGFKVWLNGKEWRGVSPELVDEFEERLGVLLSEPKNEVEKK